MSANLADRRTCVIACTGAVGSVGSAGTVGTIVTVGGVGGTDGDSGGVEGRGIGQGGEKASGEDVDC